MFGSGHGCFCAAKKGEISGEKREREKASKIIHKQGKTEKALGRNGFSAFGGLKS